MIGTWNGNGVNLHNVPQAADSVWDNNIIVNQPFLHSFRVSSHNFCFIFFSGFRILLQEDPKDTLLVVVPMKTLTVNQAICQDPNDTNLVIVLMKAVTMNWAVRQDANSTKLMSCTHQNLQRQIRKHRQVYDPPLEDVNQISCMALIGQHLPQLLNICWIDKWRLERVVLLKLRGQKLHHTHPSRQFLRWYVVYQMCQNTKQIINWNISNFWEPFSVLYQSHASHSFLKMNSKFHLFCPQII
jgi:hypothetical protein